MNPEIQIRWNVVEARRTAFVERVRGMEGGDRISRPSKGAFSPVEVVKHFALGEGFDLKFLVKNPPSTLKGKKVRHGPAWPRMIASLTNPSTSIPTLPSMVPKGQTDLDMASTEWEKVRHLMVPYLAQCESLESPALKHFYFIGLLSAGDFLDLLEAHMKYHEDRLPRSSA